ncbi:MAG: 16S rRNA (cytosine(1402)-N(4))-methyltransferase RsmH [Peptococcaceae bacterium]|nr:16S rRNA (cytosine(1402)-N(4))-methyltransferase RsmH [Peptococcaceae bacterium]
MNDDCVPEYVHVSILPDETISRLLTDPRGVYVDCTIGGGGHASLLLEQLAPEGRLIGVDQDAVAISYAKHRFGGDPRVTLVQSNFADIYELLCQMNIDKVHGFLFDLGVSSPQLDEAARGFSYNHNATLDMRMNQAQGMNAADILNSADVKELTAIFSKYGEERWASRIADFIIRRRQSRPIQTTEELVEVVKAAIPASARRSGPHPAKRVFQALRIAVNRELEVLDTALDQALTSLKPQGRLAVITFHSLEEKIVVGKIRSWIGRCTCPPGLPECRCGYAPRIDLVTRKPVVPSANEIQGNPRSRSAKLRVIARKGDDL